MSFPFDLDEEDLDLDEEVATDLEPSDYEINFNTGKLTGNIITGLDAIVQWVKIAFSTDRYNYPQYSWNYGSDLYELIGTSHTQDYYNTEAKRICTDTVMQNSYINGISDFECTMEQDVLTCSFKILTDYGEETINVRG